MKAPRMKIAGLVARQTLDGSFDKTKATELAAYLLSENRVYELDSILRDIAVLWVDNGYVEVVVKSAHAISESIKEDIRDEVKKVFPSVKQINLTEEIIPDLIGGVNLEFANRQLDLSIRNELNKFKVAAVNGKD